MRAISPAWKEDWNKYQRPEQIAEFPSSWRSRWRAWGTHLLDWLTGDRSTIQIDRTMLEGHVVYSAHDRETNRHLHHASEAELHQWLEQRYR